MTSLDWEAVRAGGHVLAALSALLVGAAVFVMPKGTRTHRVIGAVFVAALVLVNVAALSLHRENAFGVFHALAVASLVTLAAGLTLMLFGNRSLPVVAVHAYFMAWSYAGLVAAGAGQLVVAVGRDDGAWVPVVIGSVLAISGIALDGRVSTARPPPRQLKVTERDWPDGPVLPLKVAARVRIPYGLLTLPAGSGAVGARDQDLASARS